MLFAAVVVVLLIACADIASLMLTRAAARAREMAVRAALGAGRARLIRQALVESALLALSGGALRLLLACWAIDGPRRLAPATIPRVRRSASTARVLAFAIAVSVLTALICGVLPASGIVAARFE